LGTLLKAAAREDDPDANLPVTQPAPVPSILPTAAIVGTGFIGPVHVEALRRLGVPIAGILGSSPEKSRTAAAKLGLTRGYSSLPELLQDPTVQVVHLASPNRLHRQQVLDCLAAGKHVVCEKPLGMTPGETAELVEAAKRRPRQVCAVNYNLRFYPLVLQARALIRSGALGEIFHLQGSYTQDWLLYPTDFNWRVQSEHGGELRAVGDIGTHWLDLIGFVSALPIEAVFADLRVVHPRRQVPARDSAETFSSAAAPGATAGERVPIATEDYGSVLLRFKGGARGNLLVSQVSAGRKNCLRLEIAGAKRSLAWDSESPNGLWLGARDQPNQLLLRDPSLLDPSAAAFADYPGGHNEGFPDTFKQLYRAVYADVVRRRPSENPLYATFADGHRELQLCAAIAESHRQERWIELPPADLPTP
jgi:predicted dehydrogenase